MTDIKEILKIHSSYDINLAQIYNEKKLKNNRNTKFSVFLQKNLAKFPPEAFNIHHKQRTDFGIYYNDKEISYFRMPHKLFKDILTDYNNTNPDFPVEWALLAMGLIWYYDFGYDYTKSQLTKPIDKQRTSEQKGKISCHFFKCIHYDYKPMMKWLETHNYYKCDYYKCYASPRITDNTTYTYSINAKYATLVDSNSPMTKWSTTKCIEKYQQRIEKYFFNQFDIRDWRSSLPNDKIFLKDILKVYYYCKGKFEPDFEDYKATLELTLKHCDDNKFMPVLKQVLKDNVNDKEYCNSILKLLKRTKSKTKHQVFEILRENYDIIIEKQLQAYETQANAFIELIYYGDNTWISDNFSGRMHNRLTRMNKFFKSSLFHKSGKPLYEVDIKNSQLSILINQAYEFYTRPTAKRWYSEKTITEYKSQIKALQEILINGDLYEYFDKRIETPIGRDKIKIKILTLMFEDIKRLKERKYDKDMVEILKILEHEFEAVYKYLEFLQEGNHKNCAKHNQQIERSLLRKINSIGIKASVHDSYITEDKEKIRKTQEIIKTEKIKIRIKKIQIIEAKIPKKNIKNQIKDKKNKKIEISKDKKMNKIEISNKIKNKIKNKNILLLLERNRYIHNFSPG